MKLEQLRKIALALPEVSEEPHFHLTSFRVRGKMIATAPPSGTHTHIFIADEDLELALVVYQDCAEKLYWGKKVVGVRVLLTKARPAVVRDLLLKAWRRKAPRELLNAMQSVAKSAGID